MPTPVRIRSVCFVLLFAGLCACKQQKSTKTSSPATGVSREPVANKSPVPAATKKGADAKQAPPATTSWPKKSTEVRKPKTPAYVPPEVNANTDEDLPQPQVDTTPEYPKAAPKNIPKPANKVVTDVPVIERKPTTQSQAKPKLPTKKPTSVPAKTFAKTFNTHVLVVSSQKKRWDAIAPTFHNSLAKVGEIFAKQASIVYKAADVGYWSPTIDWNDDNYQTLFYAALRAYVRSLDNVSKDDFYIGVNFLRPGESNILHRAHVFENHIMVSVHGENDRCFATNLINAIAHEIGHTQGLPHSDVLGDFMLSYQHYNCQQRSFMSPSKDLFAILQSSHDQTSRYGVEEKENLLYFLNDLSPQVHPKFVAGNLFILQNFMQPRIKAERCQYLKRSADILNARAGEIYKFYGKDDGKGNKSIEVKNANIALDIQDLFKSQALSIQTYNKLCRQASGS